MPAAAASLAVKQVQSSMKPNWPGSQQVAWAVTLYVPLSCINAAACIACGAGDGLLQTSDALSATNIAHKQKHQALQTHERPPVCRTLDSKRCTIRHMHCSHQGTAEDGIGWCQRSSARPSIARLLCIHGAPLLCSWTPSESHQPQCNHNSHSAAVDFSSI